MSATLERARPADFERRFGDCNRARRSRRGLQQRVVKWVRVAYGSFALTNTNIVQSRKAGVNYVQV